VDSPLNGNTVCAETTKRSLAVAGGLAVAGDSLFNQRLAVFMNLNKTSKYACFYSKTDTLFVKPPGILLSKPPITQTLSSKTKEV